MALIPCSECSKEISDKAAACPHCGCPVSYSTSAPVPEELVCPDFPSDMSLGKALFNFLGGNTATGKFSKTQDFIADIPSGDVIIDLYENGLTISKSIFKKLPVHKSQIIEVTSFSQEEVSSVKKGVVGRAVIGTILLGPLGGIVGGMSGLGSKEKAKDVNYLAIHFWDVPTRKQQLFLISGSKLVFEAFAKKYNEKVK